MRSGRPAPGIASYQRTEVQSRTPVELVVMLYDGAIRFIAQAQDGMRRHDIAARQDAVSRTLAIVSQLQSTLDMAAGGAIAAELDRLYSYVIDRLTAATVHQDPGSLDDAARVLTTLRAGWAAASCGPAAQVESR